MQSLRNISIFHIYFIALIIYYILLFYNLTFEYMVLSVLLFVVVWICLKIVYWWQHTQQILIFINIYALPPPHGPWPHNGWYTLPPSSILYFINRYFYRVSLLLMLSLPHSCCILSCTLVSMLSFPYRQYNITRDYKTI